MRLASLNNNNLVPLVIAGGIVSSFPFKYDALDFSKSNMEIVDREVASVMFDADNHYYSDLSIKSIFEEKLKAWKRNTMFLSFAEQIVEDENFKEIVSMGERVVPFILDEISKEPSTLVWALNYIFQKTITNNPNTTIEQACKLWLREM
jgi:hypothetical protein